MLSYRHIFHAGNHADVLKHTVLLALLDYLTGKPKPLSYIDSHAGAGRYPLTAPMAQRNREYASGLQRLIEAPTPAPEAVERYLAVVLGDCGRGLDGNYPGSPLLAARILRPQDSLQLFELHPDDAPRLERLLSDDRRVKVRREDGLKGLISLVPPPSRRGLVLIDPSYEIKDEYRLVVDAVRAALVRFATGVYAVWYPLLERREAATLPSRLTQLAPRWLRIELRVRDPGPGMFGSGMLIINPPWGLAARLEQAMPWLTVAMGEGQGRRWSMQSAGLD